MSFLGWLQFSIVTRKPCRLERCGFSGIKKEVRVDDKEMVKIEITREWAEKIFNSLKKLHAEFDPLNEQMPFWPEELTILEYELGIVVDS